MNKKQIFFSLIFLVNLSLYSQDTIFLNEIKIAKKSYKKSKIVNLKKGFKETGFINSVFNEHRHFQFHKFSLPLGQPLELSLYFSSSGEVKHTKYNYEIETAEYEIDIFDINADGSIGKQITKEPFTLKIDGKKRSAFHDVKQVISLKSLNLFGNFFYLRIINVLPINCKTCHHYYIVGNRSEKPVFNIIKKEDFADGNNKWMNSSFLLKYKLSVLTNEY